MTFRALTLAAATALTTLTAPAFAQDAAASADAETEAPAATVVPDMVLGAEDAPVTLIEYVSFTCGHCAAFHDGPLKEIKADYVDTGKVRLITREVYFDRPGLWASMVARCGDQMRYFGITDQLFAKQSEWMKGETGLEIAAALAKIGVASGLEQDTVDACMQDAELAQSLIAKNEADMEEHEIKGTPSFVLNGEVIENSEMTPDFREILDAALAEAEAS